MMRDIAWVGEWGLKVVVGEFRFGASLDRTVRVRQNLDSGTAYVSTCAP